MKSIRKVVEFFCEFDDKNKATVGKHRLIVFERLLKYGDTTLYYMSMACFGLMTEPEMYRAIFDLRAEGLIDVSEIRMQDGGRIVMPMTAEISLSPNVDIEFKVKARK